MVASEYALDQLESKDLVEVFESLRIADALRYPTDRAPKMAVTRSDASRGGIEELCHRVQRLIEFKFILRRPSFMTLSTTSMTDWRSVATAVNDMTSVLDPCSLKRGRRDSPSVKEEKR